MSTAREVFEPHTIQMFCSAPETLLGFLRLHVTLLAEHFQVTVSANGDSDALVGLLPPGVRFSRNRIVRKIDLVQDAVALVGLTHRMRVDRPWAVQTVTPKAGLLGMLAARVAGVPVRVHWFTGQVWATKTGFRRRALRAFDRLIARCATERLVDSHSQREFLMAEGVLTPSRPGTVLGAGSISGVDTSRFRPDPERRREVRDALGVGDDAIVCMFLGRLNRDKGVPELVEAFRLAHERHPELLLVLVGPDEGDVASTIPALAGPAMSAVRAVGLTRHPETYLAAADIFCLPSHREGFGLSVVEAGACGVPAIVSRIYGLTDAVVERETGLFHPPGDAAAIAALLCELAESPELRRSLGTAARARVVELFRAEDVSARLVAFYRSLEQPVSPEPSDDEPSAGNTRPRARG